MFITEAWAQTAPAAPQGGDLMGLLPMLLMFGVLFFFMVWPQIKRSKEHKKLIGGLQKGDEVVAAGGLVGKLSKLDDNYVTLRVAEGVEVMAQRDSVLLVLPKGTIKGKD